MDVKATFKFLKALKLHNERDWFLEHKAECDGLREEFTAVCAEILDELSTWDPGFADLEAGKVVFRLNRDIRFSKDKSPYKTYFSAHFCVHGKAPGFPGYYLHLEPGNNSMLAAGTHQPDAPMLARIRAAIAKDHASLRTILASPGYRKHFDGISDERLTRPPRGYEKDHPALDLLVYKSFTGWRKPTDKELLATDDLGALVMESFLSARPLVEWLEKASRER